MDEQVMLIAALIVHKEREPTEVTKHLLPLANEVYMKVLPKKYKCPAFTNFDGDGNSLITPQSSRSSATIL